MTVECPYTLQWDAHSPPKICPFHGGSGPHLIHGSPGPPKSSTQKATRSVQPFLQGSLVWPTDRQTDRSTDHATRSVRIGRIYVRSIAMWPKNGKITILYLGNGLTDLSEIWHDNADWSSPPYQPLKFWWFNNPKIRLSTILFFQELFRTFENPRLRMAAVVKIEKSRYLGNGLSDRR